MLRTSFLQKPRGSQAVERSKAFPRAWQQAAFLAGPEVRRWPCPATLPDPPWAAVGSLTAPALSAAGTNAAWQGWREKEVVPIPTACCLFFMVNGSSIAVSHTAQAGRCGLRAEAGRRLCHAGAAAGGTAHGAAESSTACWGLGWWDVSLLVPSCNCFLSEFPVSFLLLPGLAYQRYDALCWVQLGWFFGLLNTWVNVTETLSQKVQSLPSL